MFRALADDATDAWRALRRAPALTTAIVATLAIAAGASTTLYTLLNAIVLRPLPVHEPSRLLMLRALNERGQRQSIYAATFAQLASDQRSFSALAMYSGGGLLDAVARGELTQGVIEAVSAEYFDLLGLRPQAGRFFAAAETPQPDEAAVVVLSHRFWQRHYRGDPAAVNDILTLEGVPLRIIGVMPATFGGLQVDAGSDFFVPIQVLNRLLGDAKRPLRAQHLVGRLRPGVSLEQARDEASRLWPAALRETIPPGLSAREQNEMRSQRIDVEPVGWGFSSLRTRYKGPLMLLAGLGTLLLAVGCVNLSGLLLTRAVSRESQFAIQLALGARRRTLVRRLLLESLVLSGAGVAAALLLAWWSSQWLAGLLWTSALPLATRTIPDSRILGVAAVVTVAVALGLAALPGVVVWRCTLPGARSNVSGRHRWSRSLLVVQVALSVVLMFGAGLFAMSLGNLRTIDSGFDRDGVLWTRIWTHPGSRPIADPAAYYRDLVERLSQIPGVERVALSHFFPAYFNFAPFPQVGIARVDADEQRGEIAGAQEFVSPGFFDTVGAPVVAGRDFRWTDAGGTAAVAIVNESLAAALFPGGDAIGRRIRLGTDPRRASVEIVGVTRDVTIGNLRSPHVPVAFRPTLQEPQYASVPVVSMQTSGDSDAIREAIRTTVAATKHHHVRSIQTLREQVDQSLLQERLLAGVSVFFAGLAALLASVGLFGILAHAVARRTPEIGLRMALGASRGRVLRHVVLDGVVLCLLGVALGAPAALAAGRLTSALLYGLTPTDPRILGSAVLFLLGAGTVTSLLPALRASNVDPAHALRRH